MIQESDPERGVSTIENVLSVNASEAALELAGAGTCPRGRESCERERGETTGYEPSEREEAREVGIRPACPAGAGT